MGDVALLQKILAKNRAEAAAQPKPPWYPEGSVAPAPMPSPTPTPAPAIAPGMPVGTATPMEDALAQAMALEAQKKKLAQPGLLERLSTLLGG